MYRSSPHGSGPTEQVHGLAAPHPTDRAATPAASPFAGLIVARRRDVSGSPEGGIRSGQCPTNGNSKYEVWPIPTKVDSPGFPAVSASVQSMLDFES